HHQRHRTCGIMPGGEYVEPVVARHEDVGDHDHVGRLSRGCNEARSEQLPEQLTAVCRLDRVRILLAQRSADEPTHLRAVVRDDQLRVQAHGCTFITALAAALRRANPNGLGRTTPPSPRICSSSVWSGYAVTTSTGVGTCMFRMSVITSIPDSPGMRRSIT